jgi:hypothetical protein
MPYRLRLYSGDQLLVTTSHDTTVEAGQQVAEFPLGELDAGGGASLRREVTFIDEARRAAGHRGRGERGLRGPYRAQRRDHRRGGRALSALRSSSSRAGGALPSAGHP